MSNNSSTGAGKYLINFYNMHISKNFLIFVTAIITIILYVLLSRLFERFLTKRMIQKEYARRVLRLWSIAYFTIAIIFLFAGFGGSVGTLGLSAAFFGMVIGWSLQRPVTGIAAWLLIILTRPFKVGDRIIIAGLIGDVKSLGLMYLKMEQVGGTIGGEETSGRGILVPTALLFDNIVINYTLRESAVEETKYILDEVIVRVTFDSDWDVMQEILINTAKSVTEDIIQDSGVEPFLRCEFYDYGVYVRLRYQSIAAERQKISSKITETIFRAFAKNGKVKFAYPKIVYIPERKGWDGQTPSPSYEIFDSDVS